MIRIYIHILCNCTRKYCMFLYKYWTSAEQHQTATVIATWEQGVLVESTPPIRETLFRWQGVNSLTFNQLVCVNIQPYVQLYIYINNFDVYIYTIFWVTGGKQSFYMTNRRTRTVFKIAEDVQGITIHIIMINYD